MRRRIVMLAALTALVAVILLAVPLGVVAGRGYLRDERLELQQAATTYAATVRGDLTHTAQLSRTDPELLVSVYDNHTGTPVTGPAADATATGLLAQTGHGQVAAATTASRIVVGAPVSDGDQIVATVLVSKSLGEVRSRVLHAWAGLGGLCATAVLISAAAAFVLARGMTTRLHAVTEVATRVGAGDLDARVSTTGIAEFDVLGHTLNASTDRVRSLLHRERAFSTEVSHQLRTPLHAIRLNLDTAADAGRRGTPADAAAAISAALEALTGLDATIADIIALARDLPASSRADLTETIGAAQRRWHPVLAAVGRPLRIRIDDTAGTAAGMSAAALTQILEVLLDNAAQHGHGIVTMQVRPSGDGLITIEVGNEGPALTTEAWQLFTDRTAGDGHGIGLPYARRLAEAEGCHLSLARADPPLFALITPRP